MIATKRHKVRNALRKIPNWTRISHWAMEVTLEGMHIGQVCHKRKLKGIPLDWYYR